MATRMAMTRFDPDETVPAVRRAGPGDAERLALVGAATFLDAFAGLIGGPAILAHCQRQHTAQVYAGWLASNDPRHACWLAEHPRTGAPVAYAALTPPDASVVPEPGDVELRRIYALSRWQGTGAAQALMDAAVARARTLGAPRLLLGTYEGNDRAIAFYARNGFETTGRRRFEVGDQVFDDIVMARPVG